MQYFRLLYSIISFYAPIDKTDTINPDYKKWIVKRVYHTYKSTTIKWLWKKLMARVLTVSIDKFVN